MRNLSFFMPTKVLYGRKVVTERKDDLVLGKKALIVTGRSSAKLSGALDEVLAVLPGDYEIFSEVENNPSPETVAKGGEAAKRAGCDYIIAVGGGSPLDAAKVIGILAVNDKDPLELYKSGWENPALPVAAIPTTAGTGSEVTQYAVLTLEEDETKKGLSGPDLFPKTAFLDPRYTASLPLQVTVDTAVDALSHLVEGYLSERATPASDLTALKGMELWGENIAALKAGKFSLAERGALLLASALGGVTIAHTGTALVHALGYSLTYFHDFPHGRANGFLMGEYLAYTKTVAPKRVGKVLEALGLSLAGLQELMAELFADYFPGFTLSEKEIKEYVAKANRTRNVANSLGSPTEKELVEILKASLQG
ncbi:MAG TPA: iron-containing alcohol dehydrogenase [Firmicutes bacterium]|nr:iron-containing alcohol dehydrogenase [Bacillota bacterium]